jgi:hypothetical protein
MEQAPTGLEKAIDLFSAAGLQVMSGKFDDL